MKVSYAQMLSDLENATPGSINATCTLWQETNPAPYIFWNGTGFTKVLSDGTQEPYSANGPEQSALWCEGPGDGRPPKCN